MQSKVSPYFFPHLEYEEFSDEICNNIKMTHVTSISSDSSSLNFKPKSQYKYRHLFYCSSFSFLSICAMNTNQITSNPLPHTTPIPTTPSPQPQKWNYRNVRMMEMEEEDSHFPFSISWLQLHHCSTLHHFTTPNNSLPPEDCRHFYICARWRTVISKCRRCDCPTLNQRGEFIKMGLAIPFFPFLE